jgi:aldehyde dehydrogenase (NAD(P)+)
LQFQAEHIATQKAHNAGFNCIASQVLILPRDWPHASRLREGVAGVLARMEPRPEYYPGAEERRTALAGGGSSLRTIVSVDRDDVDHPALTSEAFCGVLGCVELDGGIETYVRSAVAFANDRLHGTLGANIIVHPRTMRRHRAVIEEAIEHLRYGCVGVNAWTGVGYFLTETPWGAYPGHTLEQIGSGIGVVHNSYLLERSEKSVVYAPFRQFPKPVWFVTNRMAAQAGRALCDFEMDRNPINAIKVAAAAVRG